MKKRKRRRGGGAQRAFFHKRMREGSRDMKVLHREFKELRETGGSEWEAVVELGKAGTQSLQHGAKWAFGALLQN